MSALFFLLFFIKIADVIIFNFFTLFPYNQNSNSGDGITRYFLDIPVRYFRYY